MDNLKYVGEHITCLHYRSDRECLFSHCFLPENKFFKWSEANNLLVFVLKGKIKANCGDYRERVFVQDDIILLPRNDGSFLQELYASIQALEASEIVICSFDVPLNLCDKLIFTDCTSMNIAYDFQPIQINKSMQMFLEMLIYCLDEKINCEHYHEIKEKEMFLFFKYFYNKKELAILFHALQKVPSNFKKMIFDNYQTVDNVSELADIVGMSRSRFDFKFKEEFGMTPGKWIQKKLADKVKYRAGDPSVTVAELMDEFNFDSPSTFFRFCKEQFGCSPTELKQNSYSNKVMQSVKQT